MSIKVFKSVSDLTIEKIKNPFFGTYLLVWIFRNWVLIYSLIYFDVNLNLKGRIDYIEDYFSKNDFASGLFYNLIITTCVLIFSYGFLLLSRYISSYVELKAKPEVDKQVDDGNAVTKERFNKMEY